MTCQPLRIQVEKDFTQNPGETDAQSVTQSERVQPALLILEDSANGAHPEPIQEGLANAEALVRSQYSLAVGNLTSPFHLLQSVGHPVLLPRQGSATVDSKGIAIHIAGTVHCSEGRHS